MSKLQRFFFLTTLGFISQSVSAQSSSDAGLEIDNIRWQPCVNNGFSNWFEHEPPQELLCGYVYAPLIYPAHTRSEKVRLALTRLPAKGVKEGSVVVVSGGPGLPGINPYISNDNTVSKLRETYDIIGYDPRGVGQSTPKISCGLSGHNEETVQEEDSIAESEAYVRETIASCIKHTGARVLQHIGTHEAVNDLNVIRAALGEPGLTAVAYSYGTQVAALFAERFPEHTRALVLDGVVDISENGYTQQLNQARSFQRSFNRFAVYCAKKRNCPLPSDETQAIEAFQKIVSKVNEAPLITEDGSKITADDLLGSTQLLLLWSDRWPELATLLHKVSVRNADRQVVDLIRENYGPAAADALSVIFCADVSVPGSDTQVLRRQQQAISAASPYNQFPKGRELPLGICDLWPFRGKIQAHIPVVSPILPPLLFVSQRYDATTPYINAQQMSKWFSSPLITREGDGHTLVLTGVDRCVDEAVVDYLLAPLQAAQNKSCRN